MNVVELFAGTRSVSKAFERKGIETHSIELDTRHPDIDWYADIGKITAQDIADRFGVPDVLWASPPCQSYSVAAIGHHRERERETVRSVPRPHSQEHRISYSNTCWILSGGYVI